jgi:hypothetical protein
LPPIIVYTARLKITFVALGAYLQAGLIDEGAIAVLYELEESPPKSE